MSVRGRRLLLGAILLIGVWLRFSGLDWGIRSLQDFRLAGERISVNEAGFNADADKLYEAAKSIDARYYPTVTYANQRYLFNSYGTLFLYLNRAFAEAGSWVVGFEPFGETARDADLTRMSGRWVSAVAGVVLIWVTWLVGDRLTGTVGAVGASLLAAVLPMSVQAAHLATVDGLLALWFGATLWGCLRILSEGARRDYVLTGVFIGLAVATKINGLYLLLPLALAHLFRSVRDSASVTVLAALRSKEVYGAAAAAAVMWVALTPAAVFEASEYFAPEFAGPYHVQFSLRKAGEAASSHRGWLHLEGASTYGYHPLRVFPPGMGWVVQGAMLVGIVTAIVRRRPGVLIVAISFVVYYLLVARLPDKPIRFFVPLTTTVAVLACVPVAELIGRRSRHLATAAVLVLALEPSARAYGLISVYDRPDARVEAAEWIQANVGLGGKLMLERGHNSLAPLVSRKRVSLLLADLEHELGNARSEALAEGGHYSAVIEAEFLSQVDYFAMSDERLALTRVRASARDFYERLFAGELGFRLRETFSRRPEVVGVEVERPGTDLNWSRYDHPTTYVFERVTDAPPIYERHPALAVYRLRTWEATRTVIVRAQKMKDFALFKRCLPARYKERMGEGALADRFMRFLKDPQSLTGPSGRFTAIREGAAWRIQVE